MLVYCFDILTGYIPSSPEYPKTLTTYQGLFFSNKLICDSLTGNLMPSQLNFSAFSLLVFVILSRLLFCGYTASVTTHLKHSRSLFLGLIIAFLLARNFGSGIYDDQARGL